MQFCGTNNGGLGDDHSWEVVCGIGAALTGRVTNRAMSFTHEMPNKFPGEKIAAICAGTWAGSSVDLMANENYATSGTRVPNGFDPMGRLSAWAGANSEIVRESTASSCL